MDSDLKELRKSSSRVSSWEGTKWPMWSMCLNLKISDKNEIEKWNWKINQMNGNELISRISLMRLIAGSSGFKWNHSIESNRVDWKYFCFASENSESEFLIGMPGICRDAGPDRRRVLGSEQNDRELYAIANWVTSSVSDFLSFNADPALSQSYSRQNLLIFK